MVILDLMPKLLIILVFCGLGGIPLQSKGQLIDTKRDSMLVAGLLAKAEAQFAGSQIDSALFLTRQAISYSRQHQYVLGEAWGIVKLNDILIDQNELAATSGNLTTLKTLAVRKKDSLLLAIAYLQTAQVNLYSDQLDSAIVYFEKSLSLKLEAVNNHYTALAYNDLGYTWGQKEVIGKTVEYCMKSLQIYESLEDPTGCAMALGNISTVYYSLGQKDKSIQYAKSSLSYREKAGDVEKLSLACCNLSQMYLGVDLNEAVKYQQLCVKYAQQTGIEGRMIHSYITSSLVANAQKKNDEAYEYELKCIALLEKPGGNKNTLARRYIAAAFYSEMLKLDSAVTIGYFNKAIKLAREMDRKESLSQLNQYLSDYYARKKNYEGAYLYYKKYIQYKDSLVLSEQKMNIDALEMKYESAKKDLQIQSLGTEQRIKLLEIEKQKAIINGNELEASQKQKQIELLEQQRQLQNLTIRQREEELQKQRLISKNRVQQIALAQKQNEIRDTELKSQKQVRNGLIAGSALLLLIAGVGFSRFKLKKKLEQQQIMQEMRNHIASDLHDDIGATLSNINILNELTRRNSTNPMKVTEYLSKSSEDIRQVSEGISDIVWNINPRYDNLEHLFARMKRYASDLLEAKEISFEMNFPDQTGDIKLEMDKRRDLYMVFKEAINHLVKYSNATKASLGLVILEGKINLRIEDNGLGFQNSINKNGNGFHSMEARAKALNGRLEVNDDPDKGNTITLEMPI